LLHFLSKEIVESQMSSEDKDDNLKNVISLCGQMLDLADHGDAGRTDAGCGVVYGTLRDAAYKMRQMAKAELHRHASNAATGQFAERTSTYDGEKKDPGC
jgi:hypothetical protein